MPILVIAIVFLAIFVVIGVMGITAMVAEHRGKTLFSGTWSDEPKPAKAGGWWDRMQKLMEERTMGGGGGGGGGYRGKGRGR